MERGILTSHYQYKIGVLSLFSIKCYSFSLSSEEECGERFARGVKIIAMEIMPDHVHLFLNVKPTDDPSSIMRKIKGRASHHLRKEFPELLKIPTLWTPSYFVSTAGNICTEPVKKYIEQQRD